MTAEERLASALVVTRTSNLPGKPQLEGFADFYMSLIPSRLGHNKALDSVIDCLIAAQQNLLMGRTHVSREVYTKYGRALSSMQKYLGTPELRRIPETQVASRFLVVIQVSVARIVS